MAQVFSCWMKEKLRIAVWYNLPTGGARRALHDHVAGLVARGHHVECFRPPVQHPEWLAMPAVEHEIPQRIYGDETSYLKRVFKHLMRPTIAMKAMQDHSQEVARRIEQGGFDILFANTCCQYHSPFVGRYVKIPAVLYLQEPNRFLYEALPRLAWLGAPEDASWRRKLRAQFDMIALRNQARAELANAKTYGKILVNSYFSHESVARVYGLESEVCYLGIDTDRYAPADAPRENFVLGIGAIATPKRVELVIEAVGCLPEPRPKLIWAANHIDEPYLASLQALAANKGVEFDCRKLVPDAELLELMRRAGCVAYTPRLEPFGYVPLEAAACGTPVVTVKEGGLRESMVDGLGWLADPTPAAIANQISEILKDPNKASQVVLSKREELVDKWNLSAGIDRLEGHLLATVNSTQD